MSQYIQFSINFLPFNEWAKHGLSEQGKKVIRVLLRDEIPPIGPTHQDARVADLVAIGIPLAEVLNTPVSSMTNQVIRNLYDLIRFPQENHELRTLITLRVAYEELVSVQYAPIVEKLELFGLPRENQQFYFPHHEHDAKGGVAGWHTEVFDRHLSSLIIDNQTLSIACEQALLAYGVRFAIHRHLLLRQ
jgi:hypothetical protein